MKSSPLDDLFEEVLRTGHTNTLWALLDPDMSWTQDNGLALFHEPQMIEALHRFVVNRRFTIAKAHSLYLIRSLIAMWQAMPSRKVNQEKEGAEMPGEISLSSP